MASNNGVTVITNNVESGLNLMHGNAKSCCYMYYLFIRVQSTGGMGRSFRPHPQKEKRKRKREERDVYILN